MTVYETHAKIFKAFCDESRLAILELLQSGEKCGCTLLDKLSIGQSTLSHHMKILIESGIVASRKDKKWVYYHLSETGAKAALQILETIVTVDPLAALSCACDDTIDEVI